MSGLYRSETMSYIRLLMSDEVAYDTIQSVGASRVLMPTDLTSPHASLLLSDRVVRLKKRIAACQYCERKLLMLKEAAKQFHVDIPDLDDIVIQRAPQADVLDQIHSVIDPLDASVSKHIVFKNQQLDAINEMTERIAVLQYAIKREKAAKLKVERQRHNQPPRNNSNSSHSEDEDLDSDDIEEQKGSTDHEMKVRAPLVSHSSSSSSSSSSLSLTSPELSSQRASPFFYQSLYGTIESDKHALFERMLFRMSRGNAIVTIQPMAAPLPTGDLLLHKSLFCILFIGHEVGKRIRRLLTHVGGIEYSVPASLTANLRLQRELSTRRDDSRRLVSRTETELHDLLYSLSYDSGDVSGSPWWNWYSSVLEERAICDTLRKCRQDTDTSRMLTCEGWLPADQVATLQAALVQAVHYSQLQPAVLQILYTPVPSHDHHSPIDSQPPTYIKTNKFTYAFQAIVDTYGVPRYKEVNPGLFTIISFPFLFGVMYGDVGHGVLLTLAAAYMCINEKRLDEQRSRGQMHEILAMCFGGRWCILLMGLFAIYCGTIYNDCLSIPLALLPSQWRVNPSSSSKELQPSGSGVYAYGVDYNWYNTSNELAFFNSLKMKMSVVLGVTQMVFGIVLGCMNDLYFHHTDAIYLEFIPRLLFMLCTFGYMVFLILYKFTVDWSTSDLSPPNLVQTMIAMFLQPGVVPQDKQLYPGQPFVQSLLLFVALASVPVMMFGLPLVERRKRNAASASSASSSSSSSLPSSSSFSHKSKRSPTARRGGGPSYQSVSNNESELDPLGSTAHSLHDHDHDDDDSDNDHHQPSLYDPHDEKKSSSSSSSSSRYRKSPSNRTPHHKSSQHPSAVDQQQEQDDGDDSMAASNMDVDTTVDHYSFSDSLITSGIHTIEFVLGAVSNTASYLRLWALSLAHAQLASVFWSRMIVQYGLSTGSPIMTVIGFSVWFGATFAVLLCMDVLECFLHALRLHWVEFQNKFYHADGVPFVPFTTHIKALTEQAAP